MTSIDEIDAITLYELLKDGRKSIVAIAEEHGVSKDVIWNHYVSLRKAGIIVGSTIQYNYQAFGYEGVATLMLNVESQYLTETLEKLRKIPEFHTLRQYDSPYNIYVITTVKDLKNLDRIKEMIRRQNPITAIRTNVWLDCRNTPENLVLENIKDESIRKNANQIKQIKKIDVKIDSTDLKIVEKLVGDGSCSFKKIGESVGISTDTAIRRYKKLVDNGFIKVSIQFNPLLLGYNAIVAFLISSSSQKESSQHIEKLGVIPHLSYLVKVSGDFELQLCFLVKNFQELFEINKCITELPDIAKIEATLREVPKSWPGPRQYISTF